MASLTCPNCNHESESRTRYCTNCASPLPGRVCSVCGHNNPLDAKYCGECANDLVGAMPGLAVERASAWQRQFSEMGWFDTLTPDERVLLQTLARPWDEDAEPLVFVTGVPGGSWKLAQVIVNDEQVLGSGMDAVPGCLLATRWRFILLDSIKHQVMDWPYLSVDAVDWESDGSVTIDTDDGDHLQWQITVKGTGLVVYTLPEGTQPRQAFMDILGEFLSEIVDVTE